MSMEISGLRDTLLGLRGKPAWGLVRTYGSMFFLEVGAHRTPEQGEWHFLFQRCSWRFDTSEVRIVGSDDDDIDLVFDSLELGSVESCSVTAPSYDLRITFSTGVGVQTFSTLSRERERWTDWSLYTPDDRVWVSDSGGDLRYISIFGW